MNSLISLMALPVTDPAPWVEQIEPDQTLFLIRLLQGAYISPVIARSLQVIGSLIIAANVHSLDNFH